MMRFVRSVRHAVHGMRLVFVHEANFRIQIVGAVFVILAAFLFHLHAWEFVALIFFILLVLVLELVNSALERLFDLVKPRLDSHIEQAKDVMAAAVLVASLGALLGGVLIFFPHIVEELPWV